VTTTIEPRPEATAAYDELFDLYVRLYEGTVDVAHALAARQAETAKTESGA
jgi:xylulokinase